MHVKYESPNNILRKTTWIDTPMNRPKAPDVGTSDNLG